jgi:UPF0716 protein FxsA
VNLPAPTDLLAEMIAVILRRYARRIDPRTLGYGLAAWAALEIIAFSLVAHTTGFLGAVVLGFATTLIGLSGARSLLDFWRRARSGENGEPMDAGLAALASILLILPGFLTDFAGLALMSPSVRRTLSARLGKNSQSPDPGVVDLSPREWTRTNDPPRKGRAPRARR